MADWQQLLQSILLGLIFSYLLAKLISILTSFKEDNLSIARASSSPDSEPPKLRPEQPAAAAEEAHDSGADADSLAAEHGSVRNESVVGTEDGGDSDSDWEGVESTELDEVFSAATAFVAAAAADRLSQKVSNDVQLQLYALYKIATEGPCSTPQPSALKLTARAKWQAWNKLGAMPPEDAMQKYIDIVTELYPTWAAGSSLRSKGGDRDASSAEAKGPMGPVFSTFVYEETGNELKMDAIHAFAREGEVDNLVKCIDSGVGINVKV
ncbi:acyl-CoA-binding domain-containing protein 1-like isoform X2 [Punica granatum]|uniref:Acyl-CoA-binding domain-containing protein 1-like isoform X2 n=1 Tax=Punica granatum TaxID=22663 RepID=A0A6P8CKM8_PUNGR|nr:acyl-CoA-binding domain-containing protein 1-like isoform X2 [Punica granatum]